MEQQKILYLSRADVAGLELDMPTAIHLLEQAFLEKAAGKFEMPAKLGIHTQPDAFSHAMPAYIPALNAAGMKWVSSYPSNTPRGLPNINGLLILNDPETGIPNAVMDCTWITAYRTGAATGLAAKYLARPNSEVAAILACGVQGRTNLEALASIFPLKRAYAYDILPEVQAKFITEMKKKFKFEILPAKSPKEAVMASDLVVTSGPILKHPTPTIEKDWLKPGGFGSAVDFDSYWTGPAMAQMDRISTDDHAQFEYYRESGYFSQTPAPYADLGQLATGQKPGRGSDKERNLAINLGLAMDDMAIAPEIYRRAMAKEIGTWLPL